MDNCGSCAAVITRDGVACDGVCGKFFHAACLKRCSRSSGSTTCAECSDIKPCHVLRLTRSIFESFSSDQALLAEGIKSLSTNWAGLQVLSEDTNAINTKLDKIIDIANVIQSNSGALMEKSRELSSRIVLVSGALDDVQALLAGSGPGSAVVTDSSPILPIMDDIRRNVKHVRGDLASWSASVSATSELIVSIASDVRALSAGGVVPSAPASPTTAIVGDLPVSSPLVGSGRLGASGSESSADPISPVARAGDPSATPSQPVDTAHSASSRRRRTGRRKRACVGHSAGPVVSPVVSDGGLEVSAGPDIAASPDAPLSVPQPTLDMSPSPASDMTQGGSFTLRVAQMPRSFFVSRLDPSTSADEVVRYVKEKSKVDGSALLRCHLLRSRSSQGLVSSFKLTTSPALFDIISSPGFWPSSVIAHEFVPRGRSVGSTHVGATRQKN